jgi:methylglutaconyl-CoA hydratase
MSALDQSAVDIADAHESASARLSELAIGIGPFVVGPAVERKVGPGTFGILSATPALRRSAQWCEQRGVYAELFLTPSSDPWLGLLPAEAYAALEPE